MKTLKNIFAFLMLLPVMASCHFLEVEKTGKTSIKNFYSDVYAFGCCGERHLWAYVQVL